MNFTLVAYYGEKPEQVAELITATQQKLEHCLGEAFEEYSMDQVHGTIVGLEGTRVGNHILNTNYLEQRRQLRSIDFHRLFKVLKDQSLLPFSVSIGGYVDGKNYPFTSRGQHPYLRSFSIQGDIAVAMGWPCLGNLYPLSLDRLRRSLNSAGVLHKYHATANDIDNDFFFVLGKINQSKVDENSLYKTQEIMRTFLMKNYDLSIPINRENMSIIAYADSMLPIDTSRVYKLDAAETRVNEIKGHYQNE